MSTAANRSAGGVAVANGQGQRSARGTSGQSGGTDSHERDGLEKSTNTDRSNRTDTAGRQGAQARFDDLDRKVTRFLARYSIGILRVALGIVFVWFGALKVAGRSPLEELVVEAVVGMPADSAVVALGVFEVLVGLGLLFAIALRAVLLLFALQMLGTFLMLVLHPEMTFQDGNPLLFTVEGVFVVKNLVLLSGGLVIGSTVRQRSRRIVHPEGVSLTATRR